MKITPIGNEFVVSNSELRIVARFRRRQDAEHFCRMQWRPVSEPTKKEIIDALERAKDELTSTLTICRKAINEVADDHPKWDVAREAVTDVCYDYPKIAPAEDFEIAIQNVKETHHE